MNDNGKIKIHGKEYKTVALRVTEFRDLYSDWSITTDIITNTADVIVMKTTIFDDKSVVRSTGYAEEVRGSTNINKTSALENCETSAVGRALAFVGLAGSEIASAQEITKAELDQASWAGRELGIAIGKLWPSIQAIKQGIADGDLQPAVEAWAELTLDERQSIAKAPTKGGAFTKEEYAAMKTKEWLELRKELGGKGDEV